MRISYTRASRNDVEEIFEYVSPRSDDSIADRLLEAIIATCEFLADFPELGRRRPELDSHGVEIRSITERGYLILYTHFEQNIYIVRIMHGAMDIDKSNLWPLSDIVQQN